MATVVAMARGWTWSVRGGVATPFYRSPRGQPRILITAGMLRCLLDISTDHVEREPDSRTYYRYEAEWSDGEALPTASVAALKRHGLIAERRLRHGVDFRAYLTGLGEACLGDLTADPRTH